MGAVVFAAGCSNGEPSADGAGPDSTANTAESPEVSVEGFCAEFVSVLGQDDPDFSRLEQSAPDEVKPEVSEVVEFSEMALQAEEAPDESVIDEFQRSIFGMTVYAVANCDDVERLAADLGLGDEQLDALGKYTLDDVRDDEEWPEIRAADGQ